MEEPITPTGRGLLNAVEVGRCTAAVVIDSDSPYQAVESQDLQCDASSGDITIDCPVTLNNFAFVCIEKTDATANKVIIQGLSGANIELTQQNEIAIIRCNGSIWS